MLNRFNALRFSEPDLAANIGAPSWFSQIAVLFVLITGSVALGASQHWSGVQGPADEAVTTADITEPAAKSGETKIATAGTSTTSEPVADSDEMPAVVDTEPLTAVAEAEPPAPEGVEPQRKATVKRGDTMLDTLVRAGADRMEANSAVVALSKHFNMRRLRAGQDLELTFDSTEPSRLMKVRMQPDVEQAIVAERRDDGLYDAAMMTIQLKPVLARAEGRISDSLYMAMDRAGVPHGIIVDQINIFSWDVDFQREIQPGDAFEVFFERYVDESGQAMKNGNILYASMTLRGKKMELYRYTASDDNRTDYYHPDGQSVRKALLRTPIDGARLTSSFGKRRHPILGYTKMHKGADFGARTGTPVKAAGDGVVERASRFGGYGKYIRIRHTDDFKTAYAHLNGYAKGIKAGVRVNQGQIIGYVGSTGRSTGPHLHYEVLKKGKHINPQGLKLPNGRKLDGEQLMAFQALQEDRRVQIAAVPVTMQVAVGE
ncbi:MAG: M23 family metallopeptidase [Alphaproteobacteria bacterium]